MPVFVSLLEYTKGHVKFSIIITSYNQQNYISDCIQSVRNQTYQFFECIIVDDGSSDDTVLKICNEIKFGHQHNVYMCRLYSNHLALHLFSVQTSEQEQLL
jgi:GT2 family glycosyltransferase